MLFRRLAQHVLGAVDRRYHRVHGLRPVGAVLLIGRGTYAGPAKCFPDGTLLQPGDPLGVLHFNNQRLSRLDASNARAAGLGFGRLMIKSLQHLAALSLTDPDFSGLAVYHGITSLPAHGGSQGFVSQRLPDGLRRRWLIAYFRLLLWTYAAAPESRRARPDPHHYWLTRKVLVSRFASSQIHPQAHSPSQLPMPVQSRDCSM